MLKERQSSSLEIINIRFEKPFFKDGLYMNPPYFLISFLCFILAFFVLKNLFLLFKRLLTRKYFCLVLKASLLLESILLKKLYMVFMSSCKKAELHVSEKDMRKCLMQTSPIFLGRVSRTWGQIKNVLHFREFSWVLGISVVDKNIVLGISLIISVWEAELCFTASMNYIWQLEVKWTLKLNVASVHQTSTPFI